MSLEEGAARSGVVDTNSEVPLHRLRPGENGLRAGCFRSVCACSGCRLGGIGAPNPRALPLALPFSPVEDEQDAGFCIPADNATGASQSEGARG